MELAGTAAEVYSMLGMFRRFILLKSTMTSSSSSLKSVEGGVCETAKPIVVFRQPRTVFSAGREANEGTSFHSDGFLFEESSMVTKRYAEVDFVFKFPGRRSRVATGHRCLCGWTQDRVKAKRKISPVRICMRPSRLRRTCVTYPKSLLNVICFDFAVVVLALDS